MGSSRDAAKTFWAKCGKYLTKLPLNCTYKERVLGKLGPGRYFVANWAPALQQIGPRQIGPQKILGAANWALENLLVANWAPANWTPAYWAPWRQIGPRKFCRWQIGPLDNLDTANCIYWIQIYTYWGKYVSWYWINSDNNWGYICKLNLYVCFGYILPTIEEYMLVEFIYWHWIYSANNWGIYVSWIYILVLDIFSQHWGIYVNRRDSSKCTICNPAPEGHTNTP